MNETEQAIADWLKGNGYVEKMKAYEAAFVTDGDEQLLDADAGAYDDIGGLPRPLVDRDAIVNYELQVEATLSLAFSHFVRGPETAKVARGVISRLIGWAEQEDRSITSRYVPPQRESFFEYDPSEPSEAERQADRLAGRDPQ